jgi:hypothetical protein
MTHLQEERAYTHAEEVETSVFNVDRLLAFDDHPASPAWNFRVKYEMTAR